MTKLRIYKRTLVLMFLLSVFAGTTTSKKITKRQQIKNQRDYIYRQNLSIFEVKKEVNKGLNETTMLSGAILMLQNYETQLKTNYDKLLGIVNVYVTDLTDHEKVISFNQKYKKLYEDMKSYVSFEETNYYKFLPSWTAPTQGNILGEVKMSKEIYMSLKVKLTSADAGYMIISTENKKKNDHAEYPYFRLQGTGYYFYAFTRQISTSNVYSGHASYSTGWHNGEEHEVTIQVYAVDDTNVGMLDVYFDNKLKSSRKTYIYEATESHPLYFGHPSNTPYKNVYASNLTYGTLNRFLPNWALTNQEGILGQVKLIEEYIISFNLTMFSPGNQSVDRHLLTIGKGETQKTEFPTIVLQKNTDYHLSIYQSSCLSGAGNYERDGIVNIPSGFITGHNHHVLILMEKDPESSGKGLVAVFIDTVFVAYKVIPRCKEWKTSGTAALLPITVDNPDYTEKANGMIRNLRYMKNTYPL